jgi:hypothetical protein
MQIRVGGVFRRAGLACLPIGLALIMLVSPLAGVGIHAVGAAQRLTTGYTAQHGEPSACASIQSNATLNQTYVTVYTSLPPGNGRANGSGQAAYPNETVGEQWLLTAWVSICGSSAFASEYNDPQPHSFQNGTQLNNSSGHFAAFYRVLFDAACGNPADNSSATCQFFTNWLVDLTDGLVFGPVTSNGTPLSVVSNGTNPIAGPRTGSPHSGSNPNYVPELGIASALAVVVGLAAIYLRRKTPRASDPAGEDVAGSATEETIGDPTAGAEAADQADPLSDVY